jgi:hypothetical protein
MRRKKRNSKVKMKRRLNNRNRLILQEVQERKRERRETRKRSQLLKSQV